MARNRSRISRVKRPEFDSLDQRQLLSLAGISGPAPQTAALTGPVKNIIESVHLAGVAHLEGYGDVPFADRTWVGTKNRSLRMEGLRLDISPSIPGLGIEYYGHVQGTGDTGWKPGGTFIGTRGQSRRLEGFGARLTGPLADQFDVFYRGHLQGTGDTVTFKNGEFCGTRGQSRRLEALIVAVVPKGQVPDLSDKAWQFLSKWGGAYRQFLSDNTPSSLRQAVNVHRFEYSRAEDRVYFSATVEWKEPLAKTRITMTTEGYINLHNPSRDTFRVGKVIFRSSSFDTDILKDRIVGWFKSSAGAIRSDGP